MSNRNPKKLSLATVIVKVKHISEVQYEGRVYDNILPIFNQLSTIERRVLLRGLIGICFTIEDQILEDREIVKEHPRVKTRNDDEPGTDYHRLRRPKEPGGWKGWAIKLGTVAIVLLLLTMVFGSFVITGENSILSKLQHYVDMVKVAFGMK